MIEVQTYHYLEIFEDFPNLVIPEYQRAYTWTTDKVNDLLNDWQAFTESKHFEELSYYLGTLLFFQNPETEQYEIIDGQQRLTTLALVYHTILLMEV